MWLKFTVLNILNIFTESDNMGRFEQSCEKLATTFEVNTLNDKLVMKFIDIKKSKSLSYNIMDRVMQVTNPAMFVLKPAGTWAVNKIRTVFNQ